MKPEKYDMSKKADVKRWFNEMEGYLRCGQEAKKDFIHLGTDYEGRVYALDGFKQLKESLINNPK